MHNMEMVVVVVVVEYMVQVLVAELAGHTLELLNLEVLVVVRMMEVLKVKMLVVVHMIMF